MAGLHRKKPEAGVLPFDFDNPLMTAVAKGSGPQVSVYPFFFPAVVAGRGTDLAQEIHLTRVRSDGVRLFRRPGGGCSVFLDPGNLIVSLAFPAEGFGNVQALFDSASSEVIQGLERAGIPGVYQDGISDLVIEDRKIGGSCFYRAKGLAYYSAALLVNPDLDSMDRYLLHPPREPAYRKGRAHREFVAGLDRLHPGLSPERLGLRLTNALRPKAISLAA